MVLLVLESKGLYYGARKQSQIIGMTVNCPLKTQITRHSRLDDYVYCSVQSIHLFSSDPDSSSHIMLSCMINIRGNMTGGDAVKD